MNPLPLLPLAFVLAAGGVPPSADVPPPPPPHAPAAGPVERRPPPAEKPELVNGCCDETGSLRCTTASPGPPGEPCFCPGIPGPGRLCPVPRQP